MNIEQRARGVYERIMGEPPAIPDDNPWIDELVSFARSIADEATAELRKERDILDRAWQKAREERDSVLIHLSVFENARPDSPECVEALMCVEGNGGCRATGAHSGSDCDKAAKLIATHYSAALVKLESEHELFLTAHRDNMKGASLLMDAKSRADRLEAQVKEQSELIIELGAKLNATKLREEGLEAELASLRAGPDEKDPDVQDALDLAKPGRMLPLDNEGNMSAHGVTVVIHNLCALAAAYRSTLLRLKDAEGREKGLTEISEKVVKSASEAFAPHGAIVCHVFHAPLADALNELSAALRPAAPSKEAKP